MAASATRVNHWYVIAGRDEVGEELLARKVCGEHLVLFRTSDGEPVALADRCSHRQFPLSKGHRVGDEIQCGYHGLRFDVVRHVHVGARPGPHPVACQRAKPTARRAGGVDLGVDG